MVGVFFLQFVLQFFLLIPNPALAEYRAFQLRISQKNQPESFRLLVSTLDPYQYPGYFIVQESEKIDYIRTWMCWGRTNDQAICPDPKAPVTDPP
jgi:hypothetical protein